MGEGALDDVRTRGCGAERERERVSVSGCCRLPDSSDYPAGLVLRTDVERCPGGVAEHPCSWIRRRGGDRRGSRSSDWRRDGRGRWRARDAGCSVGRESDGGEDEEWFHNVILFFRNELRRSHDRGAYSCTGGTAKAGWMRRMVVLFHRLFARI